MRNRFFIAAIVCLTLAFFAEIYLIYNLMQTNKAAIQYLENCINTPNNDCVEKQGAGNRI